MNNTKWEKLRLAMLEMDAVVQWRSKDRETGFISEWDGDWYYHFALPKNSYKDIEWVEIRTVENFEELLTVIKTLHLFGEIFSNSIKIYGDAQNPEINYITE